MNASTITEPEFAHHLAIAEASARTEYDPEKLRFRDRTELLNTRDFLEADIVMEDVVYDGFDRAQTRHRAIIARDLVAADLDRRARRK